MTDAVRAPGHGYPDADAFASPARRRLAAAVRALSTAVLVDDATEAQLDDATDAAERALAALAGDATATGTPPAGTGGEHGDYLVRSPLLGAVNPLAPPLTYELDGPALRAHGTFGPAYEGPPGYVHGGWVALAFDEALGTANVAGGTPGLTGRLTIRYRRPTPLDTEVRLDACTTRVDGRRITTTGTLTVDGVLAAEAEGLFVTIGAERALEYFGERPATPEPTDPLP